MFRLGIFLLTTHIFPVRILLIGECIIKCALLILYIYIYFFYRYFLRIKTNVMHLMVLCRYFELFSVKMLETFKGGDLSNQPSLVWHCGFSFCARYMNFVMVGIMVKTKVHAKNWTSRMILIFLFFFATKSLPSPFFPKLPNEKK